MTVAVALVLAPLPVRGQEVESVGGGHPLGRCPPASSRVAIFGSLPLSTRALSFLGRPASILGSIPVLPGPVVVC